MEASSSKNDRIGQEVATIGRDYAGGTSYLSASKRRTA